MPPTTILPQILSLIPFFLNYKGSHNLTENDPLSLVCQFNCTEFQKGSHLYLLLPNKTSHDQFRSYAECPMRTNYTVPHAEIGKHNGNYTCIFESVVAKESKKEEVHLLVNIEKFNSSKTTTFFPEMTSAITTTSSTPSASLHILQGILTAVMLILCILIFYFSYCRRKKNLSAYGDLTAAFQSIEDDGVDSYGYSPLYEVLHENLELLDYLGDGYYGYVRKAELNISKQWGLKTLFKRTESKLPCAVKMPCTSKSAEHVTLSRQMLLEELKVMCQVGSHPNIVTLIGAITVSELAVIVDLCENNNLKEYMKKMKTKFVPQYQDHWTLTELENYGYVTPSGIEPPETHLASGYREPINKEKWEKTIREGLTTSHLISFGMQIAQGMEYLVSKNCIHRDLAARNVLVTGRGLCKIADFGLAKSLSTRDYYKQQNQKGLPARWLAPEAVHHATIQSDIWSFGITLYELFTLGAEPYPAARANSLEEFLAYVLKGNRCPKPEYCHTVIFEHMQRCWSIEPNERPSFTSSVQLLEGHLCISSKKLLNRARREFSIEYDKQRRIAVHRANCHGKFAALSQENACNTKL